MTFEPFDELTRAVGNPHWYSEDGRHSYIISGEEHQGRYLYVASAKLMPSKPFQGDTHLLGVFSSFEDAVAGCEKFSRERKQ